MQVRGLNESCFNNFVGNNMTTKKKFTTRNYLLQKEWNVKCNIKLTYIGHSQLRKGDK